MSKDEERRHINAEDFLPMLLGVGAIIFIVFMAIMNNACAPGECMLAGITDLLAAIVLQNWLVILIAGTIIGVIWSAVNVILRLKGRR